MRKLIFRTSMRYYWDYVGRGCYNLRMYSDIVGLRKDLPIFSCILIAFGDFEEFTLIEITFCPRDSILAD